MNLALAFAWVFGGREGRKAVLAYYTHVRLTREMNKAMASLVRMPEFT